MMVISKPKHAICPVRDNMLVEEDETRRLTARPVETECDWSVLSTFRPNRDGERVRKDIFYQHIVPDGTEKPLPVIYFTLLKTKNCRMPVFCASRNR
jgi:hypothetical protein